MQLIIENLKKSFDQKEVLRGVSYIFENGKIYGLLGRNGAGKTTLFNCVNGDLPADEGQMEFLSDKEERRPIKGEDIGYVLSTPVVPEFLTAREFLKFFMEISDSGESDPSMIESYLDYMQIEPEDRGKLLKDYSHGMKNKMQMLVQFIASPPIMLLDEPLTSFDVVTADEMKKLLKREKNKHITILSTHIMELALDLCDEIVILHNGILSPVVREQLDNEEYKDKIIAALREESYD